VNDATFVATVSRLKVVLLVAGSLLFVAAGIWMLLSPDLPDYFRIYGVLIPAPWLAWTCIVLFGGFAIGWARQLWRTGPVMEIGPQGLLWHRWSEEIIPWDAFERAEAVTIQRQKMVSLWLHDPQAHRSTKLLGRLAGANKAMGFGDISLTAQGTDRSFDDMANAVAEHAPELFGRIAGG
jgi:hypothetical protein